MRECLFLFLFCSPLFAQSDIEWYPIGTTMCYEGGNWQYTVEKDTVIVDRTWKVLVANIHPSLNSPFELELYLSETDDLVEMYWNEMILTLYDFKAVPGDTIHIMNGLGIQEFMDDDFLLFPFIDDPSLNVSYLSDIVDTLWLSYIVDEIDSIEINGKIRRIQKTSSCVSSFGSCPYGILEGIGGIEGVFGNGGSASLGSDIPWNQFSSYCSENDFFWLDSWGSFNSVDDCSELPSCAPVFANGIQEPIDSQFEQSVVLSENILNVSSDLPGQQEIIISNSSRQLVFKSPKFYSHYQVDLSDLTQGLYILQWKNNGKRKIQSRKILKL